MDIGEDCEDKRTNKAIIYKHIRHFLPSHLKIQRGKLCELAECQEATQCRQLPLTASPWTTDEAAYRCKQPNFLGKAISISMVKLIDHLKL